MLTAFVPCLSVECFYEIHLAITHVHYLYYIIFSVSFLLHLVIRRSIVLHLALIAADRSCRRNICAMWPEVFASLDVYGQAYNVRMKKSSR